MIAYPGMGFLVSLYGQDAQSAAATALVASQPIFILTPLGEAEFLNEVELRVFRREWARREARQVHAQFREHQSVGLFHFQPLGPEVWEKALLLSRRHSAKLGARTLDLLHVTALLILRPDVFFTFDHRQRHLAKPERLRALPR